MIDPAGESPVDGGCPTTIVVIPGDGKGDRPVESPGVKVSGSDREASNLAGCSRSESGSPESLGPTRSDCGDSRECRVLLRWTKAAGVDAVVGCSSVDGLSGVLENDMPRRNDQRKPGTTPWVKAAHISRIHGEVALSKEWGGWGRLSEDGSGQNNPNQSEDPWGRASNRSNGGADGTSAYPDIERVGTATSAARRADANRTTRRSGRPCLTSRP